MFDIHTEEIEWGGRTLSLETGRIARQANGSVLAKYGDTSVLACAVADKQPCGEAGEKAPALFAPRFASLQQGESAQRTRFAPLRKLKRIFKRNRRP